MSRGQTDWEWVEEKLEELVGDAKIIKNKNPPTNLYNTFTALKLIVIRYYALPFAQIVKSKKFANSAVYLDLFAGSGLTKIKDSNFEDFLPGSSICAARTKKFDYIVCVEKNKKRSVALRERLEQNMPSNKFTVICGDCNEEISKVIELIRSKCKDPILLTFVDPEGMEIKFSTLEKISEEFPLCDFIVNVNSTGVARVEAKYKKGCSNVKNVLEEYYGKNIEEIMRDSEKRPEQRYEEIVKKRLGKEKGNSIKIRYSENGIAYYLLLYTRETRSGSRYTKIFDELEKRLKHIDRKNVMRLLETICKRQSKISGFSTQ